MFKTKSAEIANSLLLRVFAYFCGLFAHFCFFLLRSNAFGDQHYNSIFDNFCNTKEQVAVFFVIRGRLGGTLNGGSGDQDKFILYVMCVRLKKLPKHHTIDVSNWSDPNVPIWHVYKICALFARICVQRSNGYI